jgi:hypothetical protein
MQRAEAFQQALQLFVLMSLKPLQQAALLVGGDALDSLVGRPAARGHEDQDATPVLRIRRAVDQGVGHHPVHDLGQRRPFDQNDVRQVTHGQSRAIGQSGQDTHLFDRNALGPQFLTQLILKSAIHAGYQISQLILHSGRHDARSRNPSIFNIKTSTNSLKRLPPPPGLPPCGNLTMGQTPAKAVTMVFR